MSNDETRMHVDLRVAVYRSIKQLIVLVFISFLIKVIFFDTTLIKTDQLSPGLLFGDRVLFSKLRYKAPGNWFFKPRYDNLVVFELPGSRKNMSCLRVAGMSGDSITIEDGVFSIINKPAVTIAAKPAEEEVLPAAYSPRDNLPLWRIPRRKETVYVDSLNMHATVFLYSIIRQENPKKHFSLKPMIYRNDTLLDDLVLRNFSLYNGTISNIPDSLATNWFFWDRLQVYLNTVSGNETEEAPRHSITLNIYQDNAVLTRYKIKKDMFFLLSNTWARGYDSRFFGPVSKINVKGNVFAIIWSFAPDKSGLKKLRGRRICRLVK